MWTSCPTVLDMPVKILGLEPEDLCIAGLTPVFASLFLSTMLSFACGIALGLGLFLAKRGKADGTLLHQLHALEFMRLPGVLPTKAQPYSPW